MGSLGSDYLWTPQTAESRRVARIDLSGTRIEQGYHTLIKHVKRGAPLSCRHRWPAHSARSAQRTAAASAPQATLSAREDTGRARQHKRSSRCTSGAGSARHVALSENVARRSCPCTPPVCGRAQGAVGVQHRGAFAA